MSLDPRMFLACGLGCVMLVFASPAYAQRYGRCILSNDEAWPVGVETATSWSVGGDDSLIVVNLAIMKSAKETCGISVPGGLFVMSETEALICGRNSLGVGMVEHWGFDATARKLELKSSFSSSGLDFAGVVYDALLKRIYLLDCVGNRIVKSPWDGADSLGGLALTTLIDSASLPFLGESPSLILVPGRNVAPGVVTLVRWPMHRGAAVAEIADAAVPIIQYSIDDWGSPKVSLNELTVSEGSSSVEVWAPSGTTVEVVEIESLSVLGSGTVGAAGVLSVALVQPLVIGSRYMARAVGTAGETASVCVCRHGFPEVFASGAMLDGFYYQSGAEIGQPFLVEVGVKASPQTSAAVYSGILLIGLRIGGYDPIVAYGNNWLLGTGAYVPAQGFMTASGWGMIYGEITIPNDPGLVGLVFLNQFVMQDGLDYVLSEVYGALIEASPSAASSSQRATVPNPWAAGVATQHLQAARQAGKVFDATPRLLQVLLRR
jgi:hypothetical protein